jgi:hypothetical protein
LKTIKHVSVRFRFFFNPTAESSSGFSQFAADEVGLRADLVSVNLAQLTWTFFFFDNSHVEFFTVGDGRNQQRFLGGIFF